MNGIDTRTDAEILRAAADRIERDGFHKGNFIAPGFELGPFSWAQAIRHHNAPCCVIGALLAESPDDVAWPEDSTLAPLIEVTGDRHPPDWNDAPGRTADEVIAALREAANRLDGAA